MSQGPSSSTSPFLLPLQPNVHFTALISAGDPLPGSTTGVFAGTPDGIGAFDNGDGTLTVLVNHEFNASEGVGVTRDHGGTAGSFIDALVVNKSNLSVVSGDDLIKQVYTYDTGTGSYVLSPHYDFVRFCSGDLAQPSAFYNAATGLGTTARIYLNGQEDQATGEAWAHIVSGAAKGSSYELAAMGNAAWENLLANPWSGDRTVVIGDQDGGSNHVFVYVGQKQATGTDVEKAGLTNGSLYGIKVDGLVDEASASVVAPGTHFSLAAIGDARNLSGAQTDQAAEAAGATSFLRPEDGAWDPTNHNRYYFVTTASMTSNSRLWALDFVDSSHPELGGKITELLDGSEGQHMLDNITVDARTGHVLLNEDPGGNDYVACGWEYDPATDKLTAAYTFNPDQFSPSGSHFITNDEESSGIVDVTGLLGDADTRAYLVDAQVHAKVADPAVVEQGQLMVMYVEDNRNYLNGALASPNAQGVTVARTAGAHLAAGSDGGALSSTAGNPVFQGGAGQDSFVLKASALAQSTGLTNGIGADAVIFGFENAGQWSATNNDFIALTGFGAGSTLTFDHYGKVAGVEDHTLQTYTVHDTAANQDYTIFIRSMDGKVLSQARGDFNFY